MCLVKYYPWKSVNVDCTRKGVDIWKWGIRLHSEGCRCLNMRRKILKLNYYVKLRLGGCRCLGMKHQIMLKWLYPPRPSLQCPQQSEPTGERMSVLVCCALYAYCYEIFHWVRLQFGMRVQRGLILNNQSTIVMTIRGPCHPQVELCC